MAERVTVIGASGALGFGLALRLGVAGVPVVVGSRDPGRAGETVERLRAAAPDAALDEDVLVCGDRRADKARAVGLIDRIPGLRCVDCGRLENARTTEALTALLIGVNGRYKTHAGVRLTGLPDELWPDP